MFFLTKERQRQKKLFKTATVLWFPGHTKPSARSARPCLALFFRPNFRSTWANSSMHWMHHGAPLFTCDSRPSDRKWVQFVEFAVFWTSRELIVPEDSFLVFTAGLRFQTGRSYLWQPTLRLSFLLKFHLICSFGQICRRNNWRRPQCLQK